MPFTEMQTDMHHPNKQQGGQLVVHQPLSNWKPCNRQFFS